MDWKTWGELYNIKTDPLRPSFVNSCLDFDEGECFVQDDEEYEINDNQEGLDDVNEDHVGDEDNIEDDQTEVTDNRNIEFIAEDKKSSKNTGNQQGTNCIQN